MSFHPQLDGEPLASGPSRALSPLRWALLDFALRTSRTPLLDVKLRGQRPGWRNQPGHFAVCPHALVPEAAGLAGPHLYARRDMVKGVAPNLDWFGEESAALGEVARATPRCSGAVALKWA